MKDPDRIIYFNGHEIDRMHIAYLTIKTINDIGLNVRVLTASEFRHELLKVPELARLTDKVPAKVDPSRVAYGSSRRSPPSINFERILGGIIEFEDDIGVELNLGQITLVMVIMALHEHAHSVMGYRHCEKIECLMRNGLPILKLGGTISFRLEPCEEHEKLNQLISHPEIQGLI